MEDGKSIFARFINRPRPWWVTLLIAITLIGAIFIAAAVDGVMEDFLAQGRWRGILIPPSSTLYVLLVAPSLGRMEKQVRESFRSISLLDENDFNLIARTAIVVDPKMELFVAALGGLLGIWAAIASSDTPFSWLSLVWAVLAVIMYAFLGLTIYVSLVSPRFPKAILRQPTRIDPLDITPFQSIGRQSLVLALVFIGSLTLSFALSAYVLENIFDIGFWIIHVTLACVPVLVFYLNMYPTHRVISDARQIELEKVQKHVNRISRELLQRMDHDKDGGTLAVEINALLGYEERLRMATTWP